jgi:Domain of unknown function (DUF4173)
MDHRVSSVWVVGAGLLLGAFGTALFYGHLVGLSFPLFTLGLVGVLLVMSYQRQMLLRNLWLLLPLAFFAAMVAVRADWTLISLNILMVAGLGALFLNYVRAEQAADTAPLSEHFTGGLETSFGVLPLAAAEVSTARRWLVEKLPQNRAPLVLVGRGVLFAVPALAVFGVLLGSADTVFGQMLGDALSVLRFNNPAEFVGRAASTLSLGFVTAGVLATGIARPRPPIAVRQHRAPVRASTPAPASEISDTDGEFDIIEDTPARPAVEKAKPGFKLSLIESGIVLGSVDLMFGAFVLIQFAYFFGGRVAEGSSYADYARRGFFELVAVSLLTLGMVLLLDTITVRQGKREDWTFRTLSVVMVGLTCVMLLSAWQRMSLYEDAFGFTHLRVYTRVCMAWLAVLFGFFLLALFRMRLNIFALGVLVSIIGFSATLNMLNVDAYIAQRNIDRYYAGYTLDVRFLSLLSADAVPAIAALYQNTSDEQLRADLGQILARRESELQRLRDSEGGSTLISGNVARDTAWMLLDGMALPALDYSAALWRYSSYDYTYSR